MELKIQTYELEIGTGIVQFIRQEFNADIVQNSVKPLQTDIAYFDKWYELKYGAMPEWPLKVEVIIEFLTDHLGNMHEQLDQALVDAGVKSGKGHHTVNTVSRLLASLSTAHQPYSFDPCQDRRVRSLLSKAEKFNFLLAS